MSERKGQLPYGWQVKTSKRYPDRVYYFNIFTGSTTWECPELDPPREITELDKKLSPVIKNVPEDENKSIAVKDCSIIDKRTEEIEKQCSKAQNSVKTSETFQEHNQNKKKCDMFIPNSVRKLLKDNSKELKNSNEENGKPAIPPLAIVAPVIQDKRSFDSQNQTLDKCDESLQIVKPKKRRLDEIVSDSSVFPTNVQNVKCLTKKRISPLNRTDSQQKRSPSGQTVQNENKRKATTSNSSSDSDSPERVEKNLVDSSSLDESNKDVEDIEMLDVSMEIIEDLTAKKETVVDKFASYYIVVDTNVLIRELDLINEIKDTPVDGCGPPHIFIPWVVIEELDKLKSQRVLKLMKSICEAVRYLNSVLGKHPRFHGQSPAEAEKWAKTYSKCNDDKILECCVGLADKMPREKVILLTNDKNLVNKALICNVIVHDSTSLMKHVKPDVVFSYSKSKDKNSRRSFENSSEVVSPNAPSKIVPVSKESPQDKNLVLKRDGYKREIHSIMSTARQLLKDALNKFFYEEMEEAYGNLWHSFPIKKGFLEGILEGILKYWCVFSDFMTVKDKRNFELLKKKISRPEGVWGDKEDCLVMLSTMEEIFTQIQKRRPGINVPVSVIQEFRVACVEFFHKYDNVENDIQSAGQKDVLAVFEQNWAAINQISGIILDYSKIPHDLVYNKIDSEPSEIEIRRLICNLYPSVEQLKTHMFCMLNAVRNCKPVKEPIQKLAHSLINFMPNLEISYERISCPNFSEKALEIFCTRSQNRQMIEIGCKQINKFYSKLNDALTSIMAAKFKKRSASPETMICD